MNALIDTLAFVQRFEDAGFASDQARALATAIGTAHDAGRDDLVTKDHLDKRLAEFRTEMVQALAESRHEMVQALAESRAETTQALTASRTETTQALADYRTEMIQALAESRNEMKQALSDYRLEMIQALATQNLSLTKAIGENGKDISGRLWSTVTIIAGVATAISATIGAGVTLLLKAGGL